MTKTKTTRKKKTPAPPALPRLRPGRGAAGEREAAGKSEEERINAMTEEELDAYIARQKALLKRLEADGGKKAGKARRRRPPPGPRYYALGWSRRILAEEREAVVLDGTGDQRPDYFEYLRQKGREILERPVEQLTDEELEAIVRGEDVGPGGDRPTGGKPGGGNGD